MIIQAAAISVLILFISPALGSYQTIQFWQYNVSLDFGGQLVVMDPQPSSSDLYSIIHTTRFTGANESDWGAIYLYEYHGAQPYDAEDRLWMLMKKYCTFPDVDHGTLSGVEGFLATGTGRVPRGFGKQTCYGGLITLPGGAVSRRDFAVFGHFQNETMSEQFVRSARAEYAGPLTRI